MATDHPTPEALAERLRELSEIHDVNAGEDVFEPGALSASLRQAADLLETLAVSLDAARGEAEAQRRQLAVARRFIAVMQEYVIPYPEGVVADTARLYWHERNLQYIRAALREAREAGLGAEGGGRE